MAQQSQNSYAERAEAYARRCAEGREVVPATIRQAYAKWFVYKDKYGLDECKLNAIGERLEKLWLPILAESQKKNKPQLSDWQCAMLSWPFGFYKPNGFSVVSQLHLRTPANLGKATLAAALCLYNMELPLGSPHEKRVICMEARKWNASGVFGKVHSALNTEKRLRDKTGLFHPIKITKQQISYGRQLGYVNRFPFKKEYGRSTAQLVIIDARHCKVPEYNFLYEMSFCLIAKDRLMIVLSTTEKNPDSKYRAQQYTAFDWLDNKRLGHVVALLY